MTVYPKFPTITLDSYAPSLWPSTTEGLIEWVRANGSRVERQAQEHADPSVLDGGGAYSYTVAVGLSLIHISEPTRPY